MPKALEPTQLISLKYSGLHSHRPGRVDAALHERAAGLEHAHLDLEGLGLGDGVVGHVDAAGVAHREPVEALHRRPQHAARPRGQLLDQLELRAEAEHRVRAELVGEVGLRVEAGHHADLHVGVQGAEDRDRARAERARAPHQRLAARGRRVARDAVQRHRERVGEDGVLVVDRVGHREQHRRVGRHELGVAAGGVARDAGVDARADVARRRSSSTG